MELHTKALPIFDPLQPVHTQQEAYSFFFFSSRRRHTRFDCDWSSDVCSSDLVPRYARDDVRAQGQPWPTSTTTRRSPTTWSSPRTRRSSARSSTGNRDSSTGGRTSVPPSSRTRSEERRVGKECRSRCARQHKK